MALTYIHRPGGSAPCPQCKEAISRQANICPHCRSDLTGNEEWQARKAESTGGCAAAFALGVLGAGVAGISILHLIG